MAVKRIAAVGAGYISQFHFAALERIRRARPDWQLAAVCDLDLRKARQAAEKYGFGAAYGSLPEMFGAEKIDAAVVLVPPLVMKETALAFFERGIPCLLEKPPGMNVEEVDELIEARRKADLTCVVAFNRRFVPLMQRLKEIAGSQKNPPELVEAWIVRHNRSEEEFACGTAIHPIDAMCYLAGRVKELTVEKYRQPGNRAPSYLVEFRYESGMRGRLTVLPEAGVNYECYHLHGAEFSALLETPLDGSIDYPGRLTVWRGWREQFVQDNRSLPTVLQEPVELTGFLGENQHFFDLLENGGANRSPLEESRHSMELARSVLDGRSRSF
ncbi:MAG: Gfo/Idh/MocA family oxidoreductase [Candidatus Glassbacteria bacterium]